MDKTTQKIYLFWASLAVIFTVLGYSLGLSMQPVSVLPEIEIVPIPEPVVFNVDGVACYFATYPVLSYEPNEQTVTVRITCGTELLDAYLPAVERTQ